MKGVLEWLRIIKKSADSDPVVMLVGTKLDKCQFYNGVLNEEYKEVLAQGEEMARKLQIPCTLTSSRSNINVKAAFVDTLHILKDKDKLRRSTFSKNPSTTRYASNNHPQPDVVYLHGRQCERVEGEALGVGPANAEVGAGQAKKGAFACSIKACAC